VGQKVGEIKGFKDI